jgi:hypothetical protein
MTKDWRRFLWFDVALFTLALILAFFLGSFTAHNSDLFLHLGLGNPFGNRVESSGWVHHAWLTSLLLGAVYEPLSPTAEWGGHIAIIIKALLVVGIAVVLCLIRRPGQSLLLPIGCTALALIAMSPRLLLQPQVVSLFFLALTLWLLIRSASGHPRAAWWLPVLFVLWVNMDQWFVLGPFTVALWLSGTGLQSWLNIRYGAKATDHGQQTMTLAVVLVAGLAACLVNPWFHRAFTLPMELAYLFRNLLPAGMVSAGRIVAKMSESDPQYLQMISPFSSDYWSRPSYGRNLAGLAYFVLLLVGFASVVLHAFVWLRVGKQLVKTASSNDSVHLPMLAIFIVFALFSALNNRLIPSFAVVAAPIIVLSLQDSIARFPAVLNLSAKAAQLLAIGIRAGSLVLLLVLLACAWPGWLHGNSDNWRMTRHVAWEVAEDPGVLDAAMLIRQVQEQTGLCKLGFNYSLEGGNLFAWCRSYGEPTVKLFSDSRYLLTPAKAEAFGKIRKALREEAEFVFGPPQSQLPDKLLQSRTMYQALLRELGIDYVVFTGLHYDPQANSIADSMQVDLFRQWVPLYHDGRTAVFGWLDPMSKTPNDSYRKLRLDYYRLTARETPPPNVPSVVLDADHVAPPPADMSTVWHQYAFGPARPPLAVFQSAHLWALCNKLSAGDWQRVAIDLMIASCGGGCTLASDVMKNPVLVRRNEQGKVVGEQPLLQPRDRWPPGAVVLSVRAGRLATQQDPNDFSAYLGLGQAYQMYLPLEDYWARRPSARVRPLYKPELRVQLRLVQIVNALHNALTIEPNNAQVHGILHDLYINIGYLDLALDHLAEARSGLDSVTPTSTAKAVELDQLKTKYDQRLKALSEEIKRRQQAYNLASSGQQDVVERFQIALVDLAKTDAQGGEQKAPRGLIKQGLKLLLEAKTQELKDNPAKLHLLASWQLYLLLTTGQAREANERLQNEDLRHLLPGGEYEQLRALAAVALGDYLQADNFLEEAEKVRGLPQYQAIIEQQQKASQLLAEHLAATASWTPAGSGNTGLLTRLGLYSDGSMMLVQSMMLAAAERRDVAELRLLRGLLALERGDTSAAITHIRGSLGILPLILPAAWDYADQPISQRYLELLEAK